MKSTGPYASIERVICIYSALEAVKHPETSALYSCLQLVSSPPAAHQAQTQHRPLCH